MEDNGTPFGFHEVDVRRYEFKCNQTWLREYLIFISILKIHIWHIQIFLEQGISNPKFRNE